MILVALGVFACRQDEKRGGLRQTGEAKGGGLLRPMAYQKLPFYNEFSARNAQELHPKFKIILMDRIL